MNWHKEQRGGRGGFVKGGRGEHLAYNVVWHATEKFKLERGLSSCTYLWIVENRKGNLKEYQLCSRYKRCRNGNYYCRKILHCFSEMIEKSASSCRWRLQESNCGDHVNCKVSFRIGTWGENGESRYVTLVIHRESILLRTFFIHVPLCRARNTFQHNTGDPGLNDCNTCRY